MFYISIIILGFIIGIFLNVCITRIPKGESVLNSTFYCKECGLQLKLRDLIPVFNWLALKVKCKYCEADISIQNTLVELLTAALFGLVYFSVGPSPEIFPTMFLVSLLIVVSFIDYRYFLIPNKVIIVGFVLGFLSHLVFPTITWQNIVLGFLAGGGVLWLLAILSKGGLGGGDIKLAALIGFYLGWRKVLIALFLGALTGSVVGLVLIISKKITSKDPLPFGPFLSFGVFLNILFSRYFFLLK